MATVAGAIVVAGTVPTFGLASLTAAAAPTLTCGGHGTDSITLQWAAVPDATPEPARFRAAGMDLDRYRSHL